MSDAIQKHTFVEGGEADAWFTRNRAQLEAPSPWRRDVVGRIAPHLPGEGCRFLEIGCGLGTNLAELRQFVPIEAHGIEPSSLAVASGRSLHPEIDLRCGTADALPWPDESFDAVWFGFCLYLLDRSLLFRAIAEADRVLRPGGTLAILDFDPDAPCRRPYHHRPGLWSYKMDHARLFLANPEYRLVEKTSLSHDGAGWVDDPQERLALSILRKDRAHAYRDS